MTCQKFIDKYNVKMEVASSTSYACTVFIRHQAGDERRESFGYHMGSGIKRGPKLNELLRSLVLDASALDYCCFEDWANDYGYDIDSRKAERLYQECLSMGQWLRMLFGKDKFIELMNCEED